jgi:spermidine synthase
MLKRFQKRKTTWYTPTATRVSLFAFGFIGLSYEVLASRVFFEYYTESSQSLSLVLSIFLVGLAIGSIAYAKYARVLNKSIVFVPLHVAMAIYLCTALVHIDSIILFVQNGIDIHSVWNQIIVSVLILLPPTIMLGTVFPRLLGKAIETAPENHTSIGTSNAIDLIGSVLGSLIAGFLFIPILGVTNSIFVVFLVHLLILTIFVKRRKILYLLAVVYIGVFVYGSFALPKQTTVDTDGTVVSEHGTTQILYAQESAFEKVTVQKVTKDEQDTLRLIVGNRQQCDTKSISERDVSEIHFVERSLSQLGNNLETANIGLGCGLTAGVLSSDKKVKSLDIVEINPKIPAATKFFSAFNHNVLNDPKTNLIIEDGYTHLLTTQRSYDLIAMDVEEPTVLHASRLYSVENFQHASARLKDDGIFALWAFNNFDIAFTQIVYNSVATAFPYVYVIQSGVYNDMYFLASHRPLNAQEIGQTKEDLELQTTLEESDNAETQTLKRNALARFWQQFQGND